MQRQSEVRVGVWWSCPVPTPGQHPTAAISDNTLFDTLMIIRDLQSQARNVNQNSSRRLMKLPGTYVRATSHSSGVHWRGGRLTAAPIRAWRRSLLVGPVDLCTQQTPVQLRRRLVQRQPQSLVARAGRDAAVH